MSLRAAYSTFCSQYMPFSVPRGGRRVAAHGLVRADRLPIAAKFRPTTDGPPISLPQSAQGFRRIIQFFVPRELPLAGIRHAAKITPPRRGRNLLRRLVLCGFSLLSRTAPAAVRT